MKWFKHMSDAYMDEKLDLIIDEFGYEGYGRWWVILELIAKQMDGSDKCFVEYSWVKWQTFLKGKRNKLETFLERLENVSLLNLERSENKLKITCPKLLKLRDNYSADLEVKKNKSPPQLPSKEVEEEVEEEKNKSKKKFSDQQMALAKYFYSTLLVENPEHKKPNFDSWANTIRLANESDGRSLDDLRKVWAWCRTDDFWRGNVLSPEKLRKQFDQLIIKIKTANPPTPIDQPRQRPSLVEIMKQQNGEQL